MTSLLQLQGVTLIVNGKRILSDVDLDIAEGEVHSLVGPNGCGKSSLAQVVMGCAGYRAAAGSILFNGTAINDLPIHERARMGISLAWQEPARFEGLTVRDYLAIGPLRRDTVRSLEQVGLKPQEYLDRAIDRNLSGGERKRIELAALLAMQPPLAILDEPAAGIDMLSLGEIANVIETFKLSGSAVLLITHVEQIAAYADRASQLCGGRIVFRGTPAEVISYYKARLCRRCDGKLCGYE